MKNKDTSTVEPLLSEENPTQVERIERLLRITIDRAYKETGKLRKDVDLYFEPVLSEEDPTRVERIERLLRITIDRAHKETGKLRKDVDLYFEEIVKESELLPVKEKEEKLKEIVEGLGKIHRKFCNDCSKIDPCELIK